MSRDSNPHRRVPAFTPVPLRYRRDGWTPGRQADFLGHLADSWCVAAAWDAVLVRRAESSKFTHELIWHRLFYGTLKPVMRGGKHVATRHSPDNNAALLLYRQRQRVKRNLRRLRERSR